MENPKLSFLNFGCGDVTLSDNFSIGRGLANSQVLEHLTISRTHCVFQLDGDVWKVFDKSTNGTFVNETAICKQSGQALQDGDVIRLGDTVKMVFQVPSTIDDTALVELADKLFAENQSDATVIVVDSSPLPAAKSSGEDARAEPPKTDDADDELQCSICTEMFIKAVTLNCSHTFCKFCIDQWLRNKNMCPICRMRVTTRTPTLVIDNFIERITSGAGEDEKKRRKELAQKRQEAESEAAPSKQDPGTSTTMTTRSSLNYPIEIASSDDSFDEYDDDDDGSVSGEDFSDQDLEEYNGRPGAYYGGYGHCYSCGQRGHWANGCPNRFRNNF